MTQNVKSMRNALLHTPAPGHKTGGWQRWFCSVPFQKSHGGPKDPVSYASTSIGAVLFSSTVRPWNSLAVVISNSRGRPPNRIMEMVMERTLVAAMTSQFQHMVKHFG